MNYLGESVFSLIPTGGNITGPIVSTVDAIPRFGTTDGKLLKNSTATISDAGLLQGVSIIQGANNISATGTLTVSSGIVELLGLPSSFSVGPDVVADSDGVISLTGRGSPYGIDINGDTLVTGSITATGGLDVNGQKVTNLAAPTANTDASTMKYVDDKFASVLGTTDAAKISPVAPAGQRDLFVPSTGASRDIVTGNTLLRDFIYTTGYNGGAYSTNGGATFSPCVFDIAPVGFVYFGNNATVSVALVGTQAYRSVDGINFIKQVDCPFASDVQLLWSARLGLFVARTTTSPTQRMMTSPDGITWTPRTTPSVSGYALAESNNRIVAVGQTSPYAMWSDDAITWVLTLSSIASECRSVAYSPEQALWIALTITGIVYQSIDGKIWSTTGFTAPAHLGNALRWVGGTVSRWYLAASSVAGNHSLWSCVDPRIGSFVGCELDGAISNGAGAQYGMMYDQLRGRFVVGYITPPFISVGTPRLNDVKALSDNIRVRNAPVSVGLYSAYTDVTVDATTAETSLITASSLGTTFLQAPQPLGMVITASLTLTATSSAGSTLTIRFKNGGTTLASLPITVPALASQTPIVIVFNAVIQSSVATASGSAQIGTTSLVAYGSGSWSRTAGNTLAITAQWGNNTSTVIARQVVITAQFRNGA